MIWLIPVVIALLLSGCGGDDDESGDESNKTPPLDPPDPDETELPDTPRNRFNKYFPPSTYTYIKISRANDPNSCSYLELDRPKLCVQGESGCSDLVPSSDGFSFRVPLIFGSAPPEVSEGGLTAVQTQTRIKRYSYMLEGDLYADGSIDWSIWHVFRDFDGHEGFDTVGVPLPVYVPRSDGVECFAEKDFSNESEYNPSPPPVDGASNGVNQATDVNSGDGGETGLRITFGQ